MTEVILEVAKSSQFVIVKLEENEIKRVVEAFVFGDENKDEVALSNGAERRIHGEVDGECLLYSAMCNIGGENAVRNISEAEVGEKVTVSSISSKVRGEFVLCSAKVGKVMSVICRGRVKVDKVSASVSKVSTEVCKVRVLGGKSKVAESNMSGAKVD